MHKSELKTHSTLINHAINEYELKVGTVGTHKITNSLKINSRINSTSHYKESTAFQYLMYITTRHQVLRFMIYYPLHVDSP